MLDQVAPKREKMTCRRSMTQKKREKDRKEKRGVAMSQKKRERENG